MASLAPGEDVLWITDGSINNQWTGSYCDFGVDAPN